ncbi:hypothetical protein Hanom_Chr10g00926111 [Helianthus anomalus]
MIITSQADLRYFSHLLCFSFLWISCSLADTLYGISKKIPVANLTSQNLIREPQNEICSFNNTDIAALKDSGAFPAGVVIRPFDREVRSDASSNEWVCFLAYPFSLGLRYLFPPLSLVSLSLSALVCPNHADGLASFNGAELD